MVFTRLPLLPIPCHDPSGNQAMEMKVEIELLVPGMQDGNESQFAAQSVFGVVAKT